MIESKIKTRIEPESNYKAVWCNGKTLRFAIDPSKPITELVHPEFFDISLTNKCLGACPECYQDSKQNEDHFENIVEKTRKYFGKMDKNELPFQLAAGGGEPTSCDEFLEFLRVTKEEFDITPNYTTNGMWSLNETPEFVETLLSTTKKYCGGVAVSCHPHLRKYWEQAAKLFIEREIRLNFHIIISDKESVDDFVKIYDEWKDKIDYFVLLPYTVTGRAKPKQVDWEYLVEKLDKDSKKIAFGANFYQYLLRKDLNMDISLYTPEIMSKYISLKGTGSMYNSSFSKDPIKIDLFV